MEAEPASYTASDASNGRVTRGITVSDASNWTRHAVCTARSSAESAPYERNPSKIKRNKEAEASEIGSYSRKKARIAAESA